MISYPIESRPVNGGLYVLVDREGRDSGRFSDVGWMTHEAASEENEERFKNDDPAFWHLVDYAVVSDFPTYNSEPDHQSGCACAYCAEG